MKTICHSLHWSNCRKFSPSKQFYISLSSPQPSTLITLVRLVASEGEVGCSKSTWSKKFLYQISSQNNSFFKVYSRKINIDSHSSNPRSNIYGKVNFEQVNFEQVIFEQVNFEQVNFEQVNFEQSALSASNSNWFYGAHQFIGFLFQSLFRLDRYLSQLKEKILIGKFNQTKWPPF